MSIQNSRATIVFSCLGHLYIHQFTAFFFVIVLSLESVWQRPYHELIGLWTLGSLVVGVIALPAENMLLARYTPESRHGLVFGIKFVLAFGAAPLAVQRNRAHLWGS